jgi:hypothetical protein
MTSAVDYRKFAEECLDVAERMPEARESLLKMAETWIELAHSALSLEEIIGPGQNTPSSDEVQ